MTAMPEAVVLCAGGHRSGSTWQYNAVRAILCEHGVLTYGAWIEDYDPRRREPVHVVKLHHRALLKRFAGATVVGSYRDLRDVVASLARMGWLNAGRASRLRAALSDVEWFSHHYVIRRFLDRYVRDDACVSSQASHMMCYEDMIAMPALELQRLAQALQFPLNADQAERVAEQLRTLQPPGAVPLGTHRGADPETLLHPGHISNQPPRHDPRTRRFIARRYHRWLTSHSYVVD